MFILNVILAYCEMLKMFNIMQYQFDEFCTIINFSLFLQATIRLVVYVIFIGMKIFEKFVCSLLFLSNYLTKYGKIEQKHILICEPAKHLCAFYYVE